MARLRGKAWQADAIVRGRRVRRQFKTKAEALAWEAQPVLRPVGTCEEVFTRCFELNWRRSKDERNAFRIVNEIISYHPGPVRDWDNVKVNQFKTDQLKAGLSPKTVNRKLAKLSKCLDFAYKEGAIGAVPPIGFFKEGAGRIRFLTQREQDNILASMTDPHRWFCIFLVETGCRVGEALKLKPRDVDNGAVTFWDTKNDTSRTIPLTKLATHSLKKMWPGDINYDKFHADWTQAVDLAGLSDDPQVVPHVLRHTCASRLVQSGVDLRRVKDWMGHKDIKTTLKYAHLAPHDLIVAAKALDARANSVSESDSNGVTVHPVSH